MFNSLVRKKKVVNYVISFLCLEFENVYINVFKLISCIKIVLFFYRGSFYSLLRFLLICMLGLFRFYELL